MPVRGIVLSPVTRDFEQARCWFRQMRGSLDGVIAKRMNLAYESGTREGMQKIKNRRTADCVIGGFRYGSNSAPGGPSRWGKREMDDWKPLAPKLAIEMEYDHFTGLRFRHGAKLLRWRPDKAPRQ